MKRGMYEELAVRVAELEGIVRASGEAIAVAEAGRLDAMDRVAESERDDFLPMPATITLTAGFPTSALRALIDRNKQKEER